MPLISGYQPKSDDIEEDKITKMFDGDDTTFVLIESVTPESPKEILVLFVEETIVGEIVVSGTPGTYSVIISDVNNEDIAPEQVGNS